VGDGTLKVVIETEVPDPELADKVAELCPDASIFEVANRVTSALERPLLEVKHGEAEPDVRDLFREYLSSQTLRHAAPDSVLDLFEAALTAVQAEQPADFGLNALLTDPTEE
jgi:hypothetical protein